MHPAHVLLLPHCPVVSTCPVSMMRLFIRSCVFILFLHLCFLVSTLFYLLLFLFTLACATFLWSWIILLALTPTFACLSIILGFSPEIKPTRVPPRSLRLFMLECKLAKWSEMMMSDICTLSNMVSWWRSSMECVIVGNLVKGWIWWEILNVFQTCV